jgi:hypothetical protein
VTPEALLDLFLLSPVGLVDVDEHGRVEVANLAARRLLTPFTSTGSLDDLFNTLAAVAPDLPARVRGFDGPRGIIVENLELLAPGQHSGVFLSLVKVSTGRIVAVTTDASSLASARGLVSRLEQRLDAVQGAVREYAIYTLDAEGKVDLPALARRLAANQFNEILAEAGINLHSALLAAGVVDELLVYLAPKLLGASSRGMLQLPGFETVDEAVQLEITDLRRFGPDLRILARPVPRQTV